MYTRRLIPVLRVPTVDMVARATLNGQRVDARLVHAISGIEVDLRMDGASQLTVTIEDPGRELLRSRLLEGRVDLDLGRGGGRWRLNRPRDVGGLSLAGPTTHLRFWDVGAAALQEQTGPLRRAARRVTLRQWVALLAREVRDQIALDVVVPDPGEIPHLEQERATRRGAGGGGGWAPRAAARVRIAGTPATREQLRIMHAVFEEAVRHDPPPLALLALAAAITVESHWRNVQGVGANSVSFGVIQAIPGTAMGPDGVMTRAQALDVRYSVRAALLPPGPTSQGGLIQAARQHPTWSPGRLADLAINGIGVGDPAYTRKVDAAAGEARRNIELWAGRQVEDVARGGDRRGEIRYRPPEWRRRARESSWQALTRYAEQLGRRRFVAGPTTRPRLVVARDQQLILATPHLSIALDGSDPIVLADPVVDLEGRSRLEQLELQVNAHAWSAPPGAVVDITRGGVLDGPWLVLSVSVRSGDPVADVVLTQPMTRRQPDRARSMAARRRRSRRGRGGAQAMVEWARSTLGTVEGSARHRRWARDLGLSTSLPWCSIWLAFGIKHVAGLPLPPHPAYSGSWLTWRHGSRVRHAAMEPGDIVVFDWGDGGITDHVALYVGGHRVIGGNQSMPGTGGAVTEVPLAATAVVGVVRPTYRS